jgi:hypothetical protein
MASGVCETRLVGPSGAVGSLVVVAPCVTRQVSSALCVPGMIGQRARAEGGRLAFSDLTKYRQALAE